MRKYLKTNISEGWVASKWQSNTKINSNFARIPFQTPLPDGHHLGLVLEVNSFFFYVPVPKMASAMRLWYGRRSSMLQLQEHEGQSTLLIGWDAISSLVEHSSPLRSACCCRSRSLLSTVVCLLALAFCQLPFILCHLYDPFLDLLWVVSCSVPVCFKVAHDARFEV